MAGLQTNLPNPDVARGNSQGVVQGNYCQTRQTVNTAESDCIPVALM